MATLRFLADLDLNNNKITNLANGTNPGDAVNKSQLDALVVGGVTSVGLSMPTGFTVTNSPVTSSGTLTVTTALSGVVKASGGSFSAGTVSLSSEVSGTLAVNNGGTGLTTLGTAGQVLRVNSGATGLEYGTVENVSGSGTTNTIPVWSSGTALGNSPLTVSGTDVTATGTGAFCLPNGTTAQRPASPTAGMTRYNTTNGAIEYYAASAWEVPVKSASETGLGTSTQVGYFNSNGRLTGSSGFYFNGTNVFTTGAFSSLKADYAGLYIGSSGQISILNADVVQEAFYGGLNSLKIQFVHANQALTLQQTTAASSGTPNINGPALFFPTKRWTGTASQVEGLYMRNVRNSADSSNFTFRIGFTQNIVSGLSDFIGITGSRRVGIETITPTQTLHVAGTVRITTATGTPTTLTGRNADGDIGNVNIGSGLSLSGGTLSADFTSAISGTTNKIAFFNSANTITSNSNLHWDNSSALLGVGTITPTNKIHAETSNTTQAALYGRHTATTSATAIIGEITSVTGTDNNGIGVWGTAACGENARSVGVYGYAAGSGRNISFLGQFAGSTNNVGLWLGTLENFTGSYSIYNNSTALSLFKGAIQNESYLEQQRELRYASTQGAGNQHTNGQLYARYNAHAVAVHDATTNDCVHIRLDVASDANEQWNVVHLVGTFAGFPLDAKYLVKNTTSTQTVTAFANNEAPAITVSTYNSSGTAKPVLKLEITGGTLEYTAFVVHVLRGGRVNGAGIHTPAVQDVTINTGTNI